MFLGGVHRGKRTRKPKLWMHRSKGDRCKNEKTSNMPTWILRNFTTSGERFLH